MLTHTIITLLLIVGIGFLAGKIFVLDRETLSKILIYFVVPLVLIQQLQVAPVTFSLVYYCLLTFILSSSLSLGVYFYGKFIFRSPIDRAFTAFSAGTGNGGYFGFPIALALFHRQELLMYLFGLLGIGMFESTLGYYLMAKSHSTIKKAFIKFISLPMIYVFLIGIIINKLSITFPSYLTHFLDMLPNVYSFMGMMILGLSVSFVKLQHIDIRFLFVNLFNKYVLGPLVALGVLFLLGMFFHLSFRYFEPLLLLFIVPVSGNLVIYATEQKLQTEKLAILVLVSTGLALIILPLYMHLLHFKI